MIRCSNIPNKYLLLSLIIILVTGACTHLSPRVNRYGLPERKYIYHQPEKIDDGWETVVAGQKVYQSGRVKGCRLDVKATAGAYDDKLKCRRLAGITNLRFISTFQSSFFDFFR